MSREALAEIHHFHAYLFVVSKHQTLNALRKIARERARQRAWAMNAATADAVAEDNHPFYNLIDAAIGQLPPQQQRVYLLSRHEQLRYREIAAQMGISAETVKKYMQLAIASISAYVRDNIEAFLLLAALTSLN
jgi:RNA polymerase sigma-70 factor (ECF subfamily)